MKIILCVLLCFAFIRSAAQPTLDITQPGSVGGNYGTINYIDVSTVGQKKVENISYTDVRGSAFWDDNWNAAIFVLGNNKVAKVPKAKLNLYTNEVQFLGQGGVELAFENNKVLKIFFFKGADTSQLVAVFESLPDSSSTTGLSYYRVFNNGKFRLLQLTKNYIRDVEYDPAVGKREHSFYSKSSYAIFNQGNVIPIKSLSQSNVFSAVNASADAEQWLAQNKFKLKSENQVAAFLEYYSKQVK